MKRKKQQGNTLKFAILFCVFLTFLIIASITVKALTLVKNSDFDGQHRFNLAIYHNGEASVVSFSPDTRSISLLNLKGKLTDDNLGRHVGLPINATLKTGNVKLDKESIAPQMSKTLFNYDGKNTNLTIIDALRIWLFARNIPTDFIYQRDTSVNDTLTINSFASSFFIDSAISNEKTTISIINSTAVFGLGNRLAVLIANMGGDVIIVSSTDKIQNNSEILYSGDTNYTIKKLSSYLEIKAVKSSKKDISDVTIVLGKDILSKLKF